MKRNILIGGIAALVLAGGLASWFIIQHDTNNKLNTKATTQHDTIKPDLHFVTNSADVQSVTSTLNVSVSTSDNTGVTHVVYKIDGKVAGVSYAAPFSMTLDVSTLTPGKHTLTAIAYDAAGNTSQVATLDFTVVAPTSSQNDQSTPSNTASTALGGVVLKGASKASTGAPSGSGVTTPPTPGVSLPSAPGNVTVEDPGTFFVHLSWSAATSQVGVGGYQIWRDGSLLGTTTQTSYDDQQSKPGDTHEYQIVTYDINSNKTAAIPVIITLAQATVFNSDDTPPASDSNDPGSIEVGMRFRAVKNGEITGVRFYKSTADTGTHIGDLWTNSGTKLASVTFTNESGSGWQNATFSSPVHITANTTYVVSYFAPNGHYSASSNYFSNVPHAVNEYLSGLADGTDGSNGVYIYGNSPSFPVNSFNAANYWVDAQFVPDSVGTFFSTAGCPGLPSFPQNNCTGTYGGDNINVVNASGGITLGNANEVYSNLRITGNVVVTACNITLRNVEVDTGEQYTGDNTTPDLFAIWLQVPANCSTTIDHVSIITNAAPNNYVTTGIRIANGNPITVTNSHIEGVQIGVVGIGTGTMQGNYITLGTTQRSDHNEDIEIYGGNNVTVNDNTMLNQNAQTATIACLTDFGADTNMTFSNNLLAGGGYTVYGCGGLVAQNNTPTPASNISFINNVFWKKYFSTVGSFSTGRDYTPNGGGQWTNNVYMNADGTLTTELVPQPPPAT